MIKHLGLISAAMEWRSYEIESEISSRSSWEITLTTLSLYASISHGFVFTVCLVSDVCIGIRVRSLEFSIAIAIRMWIRFRSSAYLVMF